MKTYDTEIAHPIYDITRAIVGREIRMGDTITFMSEVDLTEIEGIRNRTGMRPSYTAFAAKAVALALHEFPYANRRAYVPFGLPFFRVRLQTFHTVDVTVAVERDIPGVEVATFIDILRNADELSLLEITRKLRTLAVSDESNNKQWREYKWIVTHLPAWLASLVVRIPVFFPSMWAKYRGGSVLISSPTKYGVDVLVGAWTAPLGVTFGLVKERAVVKAGKVVPCPTFTFTLNFDRRVMAGAQGARFFKRIVEILERAKTEMAPYMLGTLEAMPADLSPAVQ